MSMDELLGDLTKQGVELWLEGERLRYRAPEGTLTPGLRERLTAHKAQLVTLLRERRGKGGSAPTLVPAPAQRHEPFPLTDIQRAYWLGRSGAFELGNVACHSYTEDDYDDLDLERFGCAWQKVVERHDMLRAVVLSDGHQRILEQVPPYRIEVLDLRGRAPEEQARELEAIRERMSHQVLPADQWPLFEVRASRLDDRVTRLHISFDLLVGDVWSSRIVLAELLQLYRDPQARLAPLELSFRDYVLAQAALETSESYQRDLNYWRDRLATMPGSVELPLAKAPAAVTQPRFVRRRETVDPETWGRLRANASRAHLTPSEVVLAAFSRVLASWSKSPRFTLNLTYFNRLPLHPQVTEVVGDFTATILVEVDGSPDSFEAHARRIHEQLWQDLEHSQVNGVRVLRELSRAQGHAAMSGMPVVFTSALALEDAGQEISSFTELGRSVFGVSQTPQVWLDHQVFEERGALVLSWDAVEELFPPGMLDDMFGAYCRLLRRLADEPQAWGSSFTLVPEAQLEQRAAISATREPVPDGLLHQPFLQHAVHAPDLPAIITPLRTLSYGEVHRRSNQVGNRLRQLGARPNQLIGIVMEKGWEQVVAALGVLASGAAYLPIDPALPPERVRFLLENGGVSVVLTQPWIDRSFDWPAEIRRVVIGDRAWEDADDSSPAPVQSPDDLAYVIFTSGSTGAPKGVMIDHRGALNTCLDVNRRFGVQPRDRVLALSSLSFDLSVYDLFGVLGAGGTVVIPSAGGGRDPAHWARLLEEHQVTLWNTVPELMEMLVEYVEGMRRRLPASLRLVMMSGDWIPVTLPDRIRERAEAPLAVVSLGGATEASIWSILYPVGRVEPGWKSIPYGRPMVNQTLEVLDARLELRPVWVPGELYIGGVGLAKGYWRDDEKTRARFIVHPRTGERLYRTGDWGRYLPDGNVEFLGRDDSQVKIRGHRVELGEIEATLERHPGLRTGVVQAVGDPRGDKQLVAYIVPAPGKDAELFETDTADAAQVQLRWDHLVDAGGSQAKRAPADLDGLARAMDALDRLSIGYLCRALRELGAFEQAGAAHTLDELLTRFEILPRYRKLVGQWLEALREEGLLRSRGEAYACPEPLPTDLPDRQREEWDRLQRGAGEVGSEAQALLSYLTESGAHLTAMLRGQADPLDLFFPGGSWETAESLYQFNPVSQYYNAIAAGVMEGLARRWPAGQPLRVLEVGAGTGGTTASLLPRLPPDATVYTYTDRSTFFTDQARQKFREYPFVEYGLLNIDEGPEVQGYALHAYDAIVAANVLHDARSLQQTLPNLLSLLAPGGVLLMVEGTRYARWQMMTVGFIEGMSAFDDERTERNVPFLPPGEWERLLLARGFSRFAAFPEPGDATARLGQHVMLAQAPPTARRFKQDALASFLKAKLPAHMVPSTYVVLDELPLTPNGKVDRRALPSPGQKALHQARSEYVAPSNEVEQTIASFTQELLHVARLGVHDNFFEVGGDSLLMVRVQRKLQETYAREIPIVDIFRNPTVRGWAELVGRAPTSQNFEESMGRGTARRAAMRRRRS